MTDGSKTSLSPASVTDPAVRRWGEGPRRALLIHGYISDAGGWWRLGPDLARLGFTVAAPDLPGHGHRPTQPRMDLDGLAADVRRLGTGWDLLVGHSLGGAVATRLLAEAGYARAAILEDPWLVASDPEAVLGEMLPPVLDPPDEEACTAAYPRWAAGDVRAKVAALRACDPEGVRRIADEGLPWDLTADVARLQIPTLLLGADPGLDPLVAPELGEQLAQANPLVRFAVVPEGSHSMHRDAYPAFWDEVRGFIATVL